MPRYLIERSFPEGLSIALTAVGAKTCFAVIGSYTAVGGRWLHSYVSPDRKRTYCIYEAPTPEALRKAAQRNGLPVDRISEVQVLDPYFYRP
jgi:hypothetical protein